MNRKTSKKNKLKPVDILLKAYIKRLMESKVSSSEIIQILEEEITEPNTRYRAKQRIKKLIKIITKENPDMDKVSFFFS